MTKTLEQIADEEVPGTEDLYEAARRRYLAECEVESAAAPGM